MDSATVSRLIGEALRLSPNDPKSNGYGFALATVVVVGVVCVAGIAFFIKQYIRYRDKSEAASEQRWKDENVARIAARESFAAQIDTRFDKLERVTDEAFDALEAQAKADSERFAALDKRVARLEFIEESHSKKGDK